MQETLSLANLRGKLGRTWLIILFGIAYAISQITIREGGGRSMFLYACNISL